MVELRHCRTLQDPYSKEIPTLTIKLASLYGNSCESKVLTTDVTAARKPDISKRQFLHKKQRKQQKSPKYFQSISKPVNNDSVIHLPTYKNYPLKSQADFLRPKAFLESVVFIGHEKLIGIDFRSSKVKRPIQ